MRAMRALIQSFTFCLPRILLPIDGDGVCFWVASISGGFGMEKVSSRSSALTLEVEIGHGLLVLIGEEEEEEEA
ncbi:unnamed protein product [Arabidopsis halleri]